MSDNFKHVYDNSNKITETGLSVTYHQSFAGQYWEITRFAKKQYRFIGMDKATAYECASAKRTQYTRQFSRLNSSTIDEGHPLPTTVYCIECPSDIAPSHGDGGLWSVTISVNEQDVVASLTPSNNPAELFSAANARNYDEDAGATSLALYSASRSGTALTVSYTCGIPDANPAAIIVQYKTDESSTSWTSAGSVSGAATVPAEGTIYVRLIFGSIESNTLTVN